MANNQPLTEYQLATYHPNSQNGGIAPGEGLVLEFYAPGTDLDSGRPQFDKALFSVYLPRGGLAALIESFQRCLNVKGN